MEFNWSEYSVYTIMRENEAAFLFRETPESGIIVEIGTRHGGSAAILASKGAKVFTIDNAPEIKIRRDNIEYITGESSKISREGLENIDLLFIDGSHLYEDVIKDIETWVPNVKKGGKILFHDYDSWIGVTKAVHEAIENKLLTPIEKVGTLLLTIK